MEGKLRHKMPDRIFGLLMTNFVCVTHKTVCKQCVLLSKQGFRTETGILKFLN